MGDTNVINEGSVTDNHLYVCEYGGQETIMLGHDIDLWNEGLSESLVVQRDLGQVVHSWAVTEAGVRELRSDYVTNRGKSVLVPTPDSHLSHPIIVEDVDPTLEFPTKLFEHGHVTTAAKSTEPGESELTRDELTALETNAHEIVARINDDIETAFRSRYESWRADAFPHPKGRDFGYEIPLDAAWKYRVIAARTDLTDEQIDLLASAGYPTSMQIHVDVEYPDAIDVQQQ